MRGGAVVARMAHNHQVAGSIPVPATKIFKKEGIGMDTPNLSFSEALLNLKAGGRVMRNGWNGKGMWLEVQKPDEHSKMTLPYIYMKTATDDLVPWLASQTDILAEDWNVIPKE